MVFGAQATLLQGVASDHVWTAEPEDKFQKLEVFEKLEWIQIYKYAKRIFDNTKSG